MSDPLSLVQQEKAATRSAMKRRLSGLSEAEHLAASTAICDLLSRQPVWRDADSVLFYRPMATEPDILPLAEVALASGKRVAFPRYIAEQEGYQPHLITDLDCDLAEGRFGIPEPRSECKAVTLNQLDLILVPGLCFDVAGHRLGRGKGYYDRMLQAASGVLCGIAFEWQIVDALPVEPHDVQLNCILTPTRWQEIRQAARGF